MKEALKTESSKGIRLAGITFGQKIFTTTVACTLTVLLIIIPNIV